MLLVLMQVMQTQQDKSETHDPANPWMLRAALISAVAHCVSKAPPWFISNEDLNELLQLMNSVSDKDALRYLLLQLRKMQTCAWHMHLCSLVHDMSAVVSLCGECGCG
jgi:hypothetical protein